MSDYEPEGIRFRDEASGSSMLLLTERGHPNEGWLCWRHPDGQWVTLRCAGREERDRIEAGKGET